MKKGVFYLIWDNLVVRYNAEKENGKKRDVSIFFFF